MTGAVSTHVQRVLMIAREVQACQGEGEWDSLTFQQTPSNVSITICISVSYNNFTPHLTGALPGGRYSEPKRGLGRE